MSAYMVRAHGGSKDIVSTQRKGGLLLGGIIKDTLVNSPKAVHMRGLADLVSKTTGIPQERPVMDGVLTSTVPAHMKDVPELMPHHEKNATDSKMGVGGTYSGDKSGYGEAEKSKKSKSKKV